MVGDVLLLFVIEDVNTESVTTAQLQEADLITRSTVRLRPDDALYRRPDRILSELPATARIARDLNTLLRISAAINSIRKPEQLETRLLELIREIVPVEREAILLGESQDTLALVCGWSRLTGADNSLSISKTITMQVLGERISLLSNDLFVMFG
jgi:hypothetical protein